MASVLDRYGIKEVADVTFYELIDGKPAYPVLYCDTLKVSTIEQTADEATANGGKGNVALISWDYNKDINVTIEDALFSAKSMAILFGNGTAHKFTEGLIMKTEAFKAIASGDAATAGWKDKFEGPDGKLYTKINPKFFKPDEDEKDSAAGVTNLTSFVEGETYFCSYDLLANGAVIKVGASTFPGTYYVVGDTFARSQADGKDEFFQFIISKAKITSENTITMEADGDPSVFNMNLHVLRPESGDMMKLVKYDLIGGTDAGEQSLEVYHNHVLGVDDMSDATTDKATAVAAATATASGKEIVEFKWTVVVPGESATGGVATAAGEFKPANGVIVTIGDDRLAANEGQFDGTTQMQIGPATGVTITEEFITTVTVETDDKIYTGKVLVDL